MPTKKFENAKPAGTITLLTDALVSRYEVSAIISPLISAQPKSSSFQNRQATPMVNLARGDLSLAPRQAAPVPRGVFGIF